MYGQVEAMPGDTYVGGAISGITPEANLSIIDTVTDNLKKIVGLGDGTVTDIAFTPDGKKAFATVISPLVIDGIVSVIDVATDTNVDFFIIGAGPLGLAITPDGKKGYVTDCADVFLRIFDTETHAVIGSTDVGLFSQGIAITPNGRKAYLTNAGNDVVIVVDLTTETVVEEIKVGPNPQGIAITPNGNKAYVANNLNEPLVSVIDTTTDTVIATITVDGIPFDVAITPDGKRGYVSVSPNKVNVIDILTDTVIGKIFVGTTPEGIVTTPDGKKVYVTNFDDNTVSVIDTMDNTVIDTVAVEIGPQTVAVNFERINVTAQSKSDKFLTQTELFNVLTWEPLCFQPNVIEIFRQENDCSELIATVPGNITQFIDHNRREDEVSSYLLFAKASSGAVIGRGGAGVLADE